MERKSWATLGFWVLGVVWFWVIRWRRKRKIDEKKREMVSNGGIESSSGSIKGRERLIPKGSFGWPLIGETLDFINCGCTSRPVSFMDKRRSLYGEVFKSHILGRPMIVSTDAEVNKFVLQNDGTIFVPFYPESIRKLLGETSILRMYGSFHKKIHGLIGRFLKSPSFKARIAEEIEKSMLSSMKNWKDGQLIYLQDETKMTTFQVLLRVLLGIGPGEELDFFKKEFEEFIKGLVCLPIKLPGTRLHKSLKAKERMKMHIKKVIEDRMKEGQRDLVMDVADVLLNATSESNEQQKLSFDSICGSITELMIPGEHSVPMLMTLAVKYLSDSPCALKQLVEENMTLKKEKISSGESYAWTDYMSLQFTHNVINETLRMGNIVNGVWRKALNDVEIKGYLIPKGWCILTSFSSIHLNEDNYKNPYQFDPWRWQRKEGGGQSNFTPFGGGHRLCPGLELSRLEVSIFLHHFVTSYSWVAENDDIINFPIVKMRRGLPIILSTISSSEKEELN